MTVVVIANMIRIIDQTAQELTQRETGQAGEKCRTVLGG